MKKTTKQTISFYFKKAKKYKWLAAVMAIALVAAISVESMMPFLYRDFFDTLVAEGTRDELAGDLIKIILGVLGLNVILFVFWRIAEFGMDKMVSKVMYDIRNESFSYLIKHSYAFFNDNFVGSLVRKVTKLANAFNGVFEKVYFNILTLTVEVIIIVSVLTHFKPLIGITVLVWVIIFLLINYYFGLYKLKYDIARTNADSKLVATLADTITNNINLKIFASHSLEEDRFKKVNTDWRKKAKFAWNLGSLFNAIQAVLVIILEFLLFYLAIKLWQQGTITIGDFILIEVYLWNLLHRVWNFGRVIRDIYAQLGDAEEMTIILNTPHEVKDEKEAKTIHVPEGKIEFKKIKFGYNKGQDIIKDLNLKIKAGEKIAFVGPSGGGKSTIIKLLLRFFDVKKGQILIDDQNIRSATQKSLRKNLSLVPQDPILFHRSILENIRYGRPDASDEEVIEASKAANCHNFIKGFPDKYDTFVGERGVKLSGGERQRVAIARAILKNAPILILDEATSSLDSKSEHLIQEALERLMKGKTAIIIAHRLSTIMQMDRIIVIRDGQIAETGTHAQLTKLKGGIYQKLWELQAGGFID